MWVDISTSRNGDRIGRFFCGDGWVMELKFTRMGKDKCGGVLFRLRLLYFSSLSLCLGPNGKKINVE